jgi:hypothetical protein
MASVLMRHEPPTLDFISIGVGFLEAQALEAETRSCEPLRDAIPGFVVSEDHDFDSRLEQRRDDVALQKVDDCHAVVGGDEDFLGHDSFLTAKSAKVVIVKKLRVIPVENLIIKC